jgi:hypothetical protein
MVKTKTTQVNISKSKNVDWEKLKPYMPEPMRDNNGNVIPWDDSPATQNFLVTSALNAMQAEKDHKLWEKQHAEEQRLMAERQKQQNEESKQRQEANAKFPERQFQMLLSGPGKYPRYHFGNNYSIPMYPALVGVPSKIHQQEGYGIKVISIESALALMREEYNACKLIRLDEQRHKRLMDFAKEDETILELFDRLLDSATKK